MAPMNKIRHTFQALITHLQAAKDTLLIQKEKRWDTRDAELSAQLVVSINPDREGERLLSRKVNRGDGILLDHGHNRYVVQSGFVELQQYLILILAETTLGITENRKHFPSQVAVEVDLLAFGVGECNCRQRSTDLCDAFDSVGAVEPQESAGRCGDKY